MKKGYVLAALDGRKVEVVARGVGLKVGWTGLPAGNQVGPSPRGFHTSLPE